MCRHGGPDAVSPLAWAGLGLSAVPAVVLALPERRAASPHRSGRPSGEVPAWILLVACVLWFAADVILCVRFDPVAARVLGLAGLLLGLGGRRRAAAVKVRHERAVRRARDLAAARRRTRQG